MDDEKQSDDALLVVRCQLGEMDAWEELVLRWNPALSRFIFRMIGQQAIADDVLQETWLRIVRALAGLRDPDRLGVWLYRIARGAVMDRIRKQYREPTPIPLTDPDAHENDLKQVEITDSLEWGLMHLHGTDREAVVLHYLEQRPVEEVAQACGVPVGTIKSRLHRARKILKKRLSNEGKKHE